MFGFFSSKNWNVIAIMYEKADLYRVNGNHGKGSNAVKIRDNVKNHDRTIYWAVFDQKGGFLEGQAGPGQGLIAQPALQRLVKELPTNQTVRQVLSILEEGTLEKAAKPLRWGGYPVKPDEQGAA